MSKGTYDVLLTETVWYRVTVKAKDEDQAKRRALREHEDGTDYECDNGPVVIESVDKRFKDCGCNPDVGHTQPCLLATQEEES